MTTRCCTLRRAKNTPTRSFVSNLYISEGVPGNSARGQLGPRQVGPYVKTTRTINKIDRNHKDTDNTHLQLFQQPKIILNVYKNEIS